MNFLPINTMVKLFHSHLRIAESWPLRNLVSSCSLRALLFQLGGLGEAVECGLETVPVALEDGAVDKATVRRCT